MSEHVRYTRNRREFLCEAFGGFGALAYTSMLQAEGLNPLAPKTPPEPAKAKSVIFLFMAGGPSHLETFDPKPLLNKLSGQKRPAAFGEAKYQFIKGTPLLLGTKRTFKRYGKSGIEVSDLFPHTAECIDDMAVIRSCQGDAVVHSAAQYQVMTGRVIPGFPGMGAWVMYGLGSESESLPGYVVIPDPSGAIEAGMPMYSNGFLPSIYQPTMLRSGTKPVLNLDLPKNVTLDTRRQTLKLIRNLNEATLLPDDNELAARVNAYDMAFKMQTEAPAVFDLKSEPQETLDLYGVGKKPTDDYGRRLLLARRMVEKGTRFICVVSGGGAATQWDAHDDIEENHNRMAAQVDQPIAALLKDLKRRGLLDTTLVLWGGEFGRSPEAQGGKGRDHLSIGFTMWMA
ncbi:MAG: DUF1501 domain-containing protein, partial [Bryobacteraceae bacterium]